MFVVLASVILSFCVGDGRDMSFLPAGDHEGRPYRAGVLPYAGDHEGRPYTLNSQLSTLNFQLSVLMPHALRLYDFSTLFSTSSGRLQKKSMPVSSSSSSMVHTRSVMLTSVL